MVEALSTAGKRIDGIKVEKIERVFVSDGYVPRAMNLKVKG